MDQHAAKFQPILNTTPQTHFYSTAFTPGPEARLGQNMIS